jgi:hypothetical protein
MGGGAPRHGSGVWRAALEPGLGCPGCGASGASPQRVRRRVAAIGPQPAVRRAATRRRAGRRFPHNLPRRSSPEVGERWSGAAGKEFPGCQLDKPTSRYLTSRRRVSCICRFPLGFLSHVSRRERVPPGSDAEHSRRRAGGLRSASAPFDVACSTMLRAHARGRCGAFFIGSSVSDRRAFAFVAPRRAVRSVICGREAMVVAMGRTVAPKVRTDVA